MAESDLHLKLDRILANQAAHRQALADNETSIKTLIAGMHALSDDQATMRELLTQLAEAMSKEQDNTELRDLIQKIEAHMARSVENGEHMLETLESLPRAMSEAAVDGVRLALGDAIDIPKND